MKTLREVVLQRHQAAEMKLQAIRPEALAAEARGVARPSPGVAAQVWLEMIWPWRRVWAGVAATWVVILGLSLAAGDTPEAAAASMRPNPQVREALQQQEQLLTQLLGIEAPPPAAPTKPVGPRSETDREPNGGREASRSNVPRRAGVLLA